MASSGAIGHYVNPELDKLKGKGFKKGSIEMKAKMQALRDKKKNNKSIGGSFRSLNGDGLNGGSFMIL